MPPKRQRPDPQPWRRDYNYFRDYDPATGRYVQSDPIGLAGGLNTYQYANANPLRWSDPLGLEVLYCKAPAQIAGGLVNHVWLKTDTKEAGMDALRNLGRHDAPPAGDAYDFLYLTDVGIVEHTGDSVNRPGATCETVDNVDENRVNEMLEIGKPLGTFSLVNNCTTFAYHVLVNSRLGARPIPDPHRAMIELARRGAKGRDL